MSFRLSDRSMSMLQGVDEQLVATVKLAIADHEDRLRCNLRPAHDGGATGSC
jgi:hypothetical protein